MLTLMLILTKRHLKFKHKLLVNGERLIGDSFHMMLRTGSYCHVWHRWFDNNIVFYGTKTYPKGAKENEKFLLTPLDVEPIALAILINNNQPKIHFCCEFVQCRAYSDVNTFFVYLRNKLI